MLDHYELIQNLTSDPISSQQHRRQLNDFAVELGWRPSDQLELPGTSQFASGHLVVEHGLQNSAVISFLKRPTRYPDLNLPDRKALLNASYNNLTDWHIAVDYEGVSFVYNRVDPPQFYSYRRSVTRERTQDLTSQCFDGISRDHPSPNVPALDTALIRTISLWKRVLSSEIPNLRNEEISSLFNAVILMRALEDHLSKTRPGTFVRLKERTEGGARQTIADLIQDSLNGFNIPNAAQLVDVQRLRAFDPLDASAIGELIADFYRNRYERYFDYDFSIMSKHALSRIYEHYVSLLRYDEPSPQESFLPSLPEEKIDRSFGNVYTPEFIARFFAKYVRKELPPTVFQRLRVTDPACGSGIFLRTMLETKFEALLSSFTTQNITESFQSVVGIDIDPNACAAAKLSLSLLSLALNGSIPPSLHIIEADAIKEFFENPQLRNSSDVLVENPPFVNIESLPPERRSLLLNILEGDARGKTDLYLGILKASLAMLRDNGFGLFVLPKNFLISNNAGPLRDEVTRLTSLHCVVDLSAVRVFEDVGAYVVLLIFRKQSVRNPNRKVLVVRCND